ncbi:hypothetical protein J0X19_17140 [Hymenobacter sp. BT186]|uniref:Lipoprotein n=1 Tax=Hymenobacter telluris TaxID=2816474 RepID=A0A939EYT8_9BACT|nr:hypothetical protein [Hymenobacter telluris]MBO0359689.1 hypothetical protein [Hymenobacter telluris]MBW3375716.1 hypothetical protein [Hymenobacter norwichensis]
MKRNKYSLPAFLLLASVLSVVTSCNEKNLYLPSGKVKNPGGKEITVEDNTKNGAKKYQKEFKKNKNRAVYIDKNKLTEFINSLGSDCKGIRIYGSINQDGGFEEVGKIGIIIVGVGQDNKDITKDKSTLAAAKAFASYDRCPDNCDKTSGLYDPTVED